ncbi:hypothetical protein Desaf_0422 [Desulfocurvibacter africanus subsp. africanus str. Walvis Bay]|uniref:Uncharacterized protein n=1 Tax=Desulfocurvibacter africanus subsp. africanus str. Walvis Bay TaxID=690850 RepID=F3YVP1_DESAF|nr:hypothetical protein Desaf_0422 [Desulfocurvibacter africanus subsp. africanus str. Walvis Bay]
MEMDAETARWSLSRGQAAIHPTSSALMLTDFDL